jgi:hypothetical protein
VSFASTQLYDAANHLGLFANRTPETQLTLLDGSTSPTTRNGDVFSMGAFFR